MENNNLTVKHTRIYLVDVEPDGIWKNLMGVFYPRFLEGYIFYSDDREKIKAAYSHELSHSTFFENIPLCKKFKD